MATLKNHPQFWLRADAAEAFNRAEDDHGVFSVNSAGRTVAEQNQLIAAWDRGGPLNRPPYLYAPARPATNSKHVANGGVAIDISDWRRFAAICRGYGFVHAYPTSDPVHFEFAGNPVRGGYQNGSAELRSFQEKLIQMGHDLGPTGADSVLGPKTVLATKHEQRLAGPNGYPKGNLRDDGIPGPASMGYLDWWLVGRHQTAPAATPPAQQYHVGTVRDIATMPHTSGLQKIARLHGYKGAIDNKFGAGSQAGLQKFLDRNYRGSLAAWLRAKWGYSGNDNWGPNMQAAASRAEQANWKAL